MNFPSTEEIDRYSRLRALVNRADELPSAEWPAFVERECPSDPALRAVALRLLEQSRRACAEGFLEPVMSAMCSTEATEDYRPRRAVRVRATARSASTRSSAASPRRAARRPPISPSTPTWNAMSS